MNVYSLEDVNNLMICKLIFCNGKQLAQMICTDQLSVWDWLKYNIRNQDMLFRTPKRNKMPKNEVPQTFLQNAYEEAAKRMTKTLAIGKTKTLTRSKKPLHFPMMETERKSSMARTWGKKLKKD